MFTSAHICLLYGAMDLSLIGPNRREVTHLSRTWLTLADCVGIAIGAVFAVALLALLFL